MKEYIEREAVRQAHIKASLTTRLIDAQPAARRRERRWWRRDTIHLGLVVFARNPFQMDTTGTLFVLSLGNKE